MLRKLSFKNYKSFKAKQDITFAPITLLVGPNSAGKSSIIKLIGLLKQSIFQYDTNEFINYDGHQFNLKNFNNISHRYENGDIEISMITDRYIQDEVAIMTPYCNLSGREKKDNYYELLLKITNKGNNAVLNQHSYPSNKNRMTFNYNKKYNTYHIVQLDRLIQKLFDSISEKIKEITDWHKRSHYSISDILFKTPAKYSFEQDFLLLIDDHINDNSDRAGFIPSGLSKNLHRRNTLDNLLNEEDFKPEFEPFYDRTEFLLNDLLEFRAGIRYRYGDNRLRRKELKEAIDAVQDHWDMLKEKGYINNKKMKMDIYMQILCYYDYLILHFLENNKTQKIINQIENWCNNLLIDVRETFKGVHHFPALRPEPKRYYTKQEIDQIFYHNPGPISYGELDFDIYSKYIQTLGFNYEIETEKISQKHELYAIRLKELDSGVVSYLDEVGFGFSQILPYIGRKNSHDTLHILEQPELHLHPNAQASFAKFLMNDFYHDTLSGKGKIKSTQYSRFNYLIETHSEHILRGLQVEIAKGNFNNKAVAVYYVGKRKNGNSYVKHLPINDNGMFEDKWPEGFYEIGFKQAMELMKAN